MRLRGESGEELLDRCRWRFMHSSGFVSGGFELTRSDVLLFGVQKPGAG